MLVVSCVTNPYLLFNTVLMNLAPFCHTLVGVFNYLYTTVVFNHSCVCVATYDEEFRLCDGNVRAVFLVVAAAADVSLIFIIIYTFFLGQKIIECQTRRCFHLFYFCLLIFVYLFTFFFTYDIWPDL